MLSFGSAAPLANVSSTVASTHAGTSSKPIFPTPIQEITQMRQALDVEEGVDTYQHGDREVSFEDHWAEEQFNNQPFVRLGASLKAFVADIGSKIGKALQTTPAPVVEPDDFDRVAVSKVFKKILLQKIDSPDIWHDSTAAGLATDFDENLKTIDKAAIKKEVQLYSPQVQHYYLSLQNTHQLLLKYEKIGRASLDKISTLPPEFLREAMRIMSGDEDVFCLLQHLLTPEQMQALQTTQSLFAKALLLETVFIKTAAVLEQNSVRIQESANGLHLSLRPAQSMDPLTCGKVYHPDFVKPQDLSDLGNFRSGRDFQEVQCQHQGLAGVSQAFKAALQKHLLAANLGPDLSSLEVVNEFTELLNSMEVSGDEASSTQQDQFMAMITVEMMLSKLGQAETASKARLQLPRDYHLNYVLKITSEALLDGSMRVPRFCFLRSVLKDEQILAARDTFVHAVKRLHLGAIAKILRADLGLSEPEITNVEKPEINVKTPDPGVLSHYGRMRDEKLKDLPCPKRNQTYERIDKSVNAHAEPYDYESFFLRERFNPRP
jgi:hypothetical protein